MNNAVFRSLALLFLLTSFAFGRETNSRNRLTLNGIWEFSPLKAAEASTLLTLLDSSAGHMEVPGYWYPVNSNEARFGLGHGPRWKDFTPETLVRAQFQRRAHIPKHWQATSISLSVGPIGAKTAQFWVNQELAGQLGPEGGEINITPFVRTGQANLFSVSLEVDPESPRARGILGNIGLVTRPSGAHIGEAYIRNLPAKKGFGQLAVSLQLKDCAYADHYFCRIRVVDDRNETVMERTADLSLEDAPDQWKHFAIPAEQLIPWSPENPKMYRAEIFVRGIGLYDEIEEAFGYRPLAVGDAGLELNGENYLLKPTLLNLPHTKEQAQNYFARLKSMGFSIGIIPPHATQFKSDQLLEYLQELFEAADSVGFPLAVPVADPDTIDRRKQEEAINSHPSIFIAYLDEDSPEPFESQFEQLYGMQDANLDAIPALLQHSKAQIALLGIQGEQLENLRMTTPAVSFKKDAADLHAHVFKQRILRLLEHPDQVQQAISLAPLKLLERPDLFKESKELKELLESPVISTLDDTGSNAAPPARRFYSDSEIVRHLTLANTSKGPQKIQGSWRLTYKNEVINESTFECEIAPLAVEKLAIRAALPHTVRADHAALAIDYKTQGAGLQSTFHRELEFELHPTQTHRSTAPLLILDPEGGFAKKLDSLGYHLIKWEGQKAPGQLLLIGPYGLDTTSNQQLKEFIDTGGKAIICEQSEEWYQRCGLSCEFWPQPPVKELQHTQLSSSLFNGFNNEFFNSWNGRSNEPNEHAELTQLRESTVFGTPTALLKSRHPDGHWASPLVFCRKHGGFAVLSTLQISEYLQQEPAADLFMHRLIWFAQHTR